MISNNERNDQAICSKFVQREVMQCVSSLVSEIMSKAEHFPEYEDDIYSLAYGAPDYEQAAKDDGWAKDDCGFFSDEGRTDATDDWQELCELMCIDLDEYRSEVLEHWIVSDYLADKLEAYGECIVTDIFNLTIWGRTCSGQAILLDSVIHDICYDMEILTGQKNEWKA